MFRGPVHLTLTLFLSFPLIFAEIKENCQLTDTKCCVYSGVDLNYLEDDSFSELILNVSPTNSPKSVINLVFQLSKINIISKKICERFSETKNLEFLTSQVTYYEENAFHACKKLEKITIKYNKIKVIHKKLFKLNPELLEIDMSHNNIDYIEPNELTENKKLERLDLSYNMIDYFKLDFIPETLKEINLENNLIQYIGNAFDSSKINWKIGRNYLHCSEAIEFYLSKVAANEQPPQLQVRKIEGLVISKYQTIECYEDLNPVLELLNGLSTVQPVTFSPVSTTNPVVSPNAQIVQPNNEPKTASKLMGLNGFIALMVGIISVLLLNFFILLLIWFLFKKLSALLRIEKDLNEVEIQFVSAYT